MAEEHELSLSREEMRRIGYRTVDLLVEHFATLPDKPATRKASRAEMEERFREPLPETGMDALELLDLVERDIFSNIMHLDHPRFFAFVPSPSNYVSAMADALAAGFNVFAGAWLEGSAPAQIELVTIDWLCRACGLPQGAGGLFVSGGSMANITALAAARELHPHGHLDLATIYFSDQTHSSIERGLRVLGFEDHQLRRIPSDDGFRLEMTALAATLDADRQAGRHPFCVVANAGTTNTGAIDPLIPLADLCRQEGLWLHVDGAYGAAAVLCQRGQGLLQGLELADSLSLDPHKWLFQPYEIGCVLLRKGEQLHSVFQVMPEYLADAAAAAGEVNFFDRGIQLTRGFRALKLWMSLKTFGAKAFGAALEWGFHLAEVAEESVRALPEWEVVTPAQMGVVTFRYAPFGYGEDRCALLNRRLVADLVQDGFAMVTSTELRGRTVLRMCPINPRTSEDDIRKTIALLAQLAARAS